MRKATKSVATWFGITASIAGIEHGFIEIQQGRAQPESLMISSIGQSCMSEDIWNACEPAMTIIPNFLITGILAVLIGLLILIWSIRFIQKKYGGFILILLSIALLLFGGGLFPPLIGIVGGIAGTKINLPITQKSTSQITQFTAKLWPCPLIVLMVWVFGQWVVGYFFNELLMTAMYYVLFLIIITLPLSVYTAYAFDVQSTLIEIEANKKTDAVSHRTVKLID